MENQYDVAVVGAGPGGYVAAIRAAQLGLKTVIIEAQHLGGVCLNWGCIPTKSLLKAADLYAAIKHAQDFGINCKEASFDIKKVVQRSRNVATQLSSGIQHLLKKNKVEHIAGYARFKDPRTLSIEVDKGKEHALTAKHIILATGAQARALADHPFDTQYFWSAKEAMTPPALPKTLLIIGSGAIGVEFASFYNAFGTKVTMIEMQDRVLPAEDKEISALARKAFENKGITIHTSTLLEKAEIKDKKVEAHLKKDDKNIAVSVDHVIVAIGIIPNTDDLGLEHTKVEMEKGHIKVNEWGETNEKGIYAIGDLTASPWLAHKASHEGILVAEKIAGLTDLHPIRSRDVPGCTYASPQIASIGLTEQEALQQSIPIKVGRFPYMANGKALAAGESEGLVKTIFHETTGELLGAHIIGAEATEMIQGLTVAMKLETTEKELMETIFPHPTLSEMIHESVLNAYGKTIHY